MSTVNIKFFRPALIGPGSAAAMGQDVATPEVFTSSSSSQATTSSAPDNRTYIRIVSTGNIWVTFGTSPTAVTNQGTLVYAGIPEYFKLEAGQKVALID